MSKIWLPFLRNDFLSLAFVFMNRSRKFKPWPTFNFKAGLQIMFFLMLATTIIRSAVVTQTKKNTYSPPQRTLAPKILYQSDQL